MKRLFAVPLLTVLLLGSSLLASTTQAHPHVVENPNHTQTVANGQNHPGFQPVNDDGLRLSCAGTLGRVPGGVEMRWPAG